VFFTLTTQVWAQGASYPGFVCLCPRQEKLDKVRFELYARGSGPLSILPAQQFCDTGQLRTDAHPHPSPELPTVVLISASVSRRVWRRGYMLPVRAWMIAPVVLPVARSVVYCVDLRVAAD